MLHPPALPVVPVYSFFSASIRVTSAPSMPAVPLVTDTATVTSSGVGVGGIMLPLRMQEQKHH